MELLTIAGIVAFMILVVFVVIKLDSGNGSILLDSGEIPERLYEVPSRLKFESTWFSDDYVTPYFYHNGMWISLKRVDYDFTDPTGDRYLSPISWKLGDGNFDHEKKKWSTVGACLEHNREMRKECNKQNVSLAKEREERRRKKEEAWRRANG